MTVPSPGAVNPLAFHGPKTRDEVFGDTGQKAAVVRSAGDKRRAIIEGVEIVFGSAGDGFFKDLMFFPKVDDVLL